MAEFEAIAQPETPTLRRAIRQQLSTFDPSIRVIAEDFFAATSSIDLLCVGHEGELLSLRIARPGTEDETLVRCLSDLTWLKPRGADLLKLVPGLGIEASAEPRALLLARSFSDEIQLAVQNFPSNTIQLIVYETFRQRGQLCARFDLHRPRPLMRDGNRPHPVSMTDETLPEAQNEALPRPPRAESTAPAADRTSGGAPNALADLAPTSGFRTGLTDADLRIADPSVAASADSPDPTDDLRDLATSPS